MGILNRPSEGLPSVLIALVRSLQALGPTSQDALTALVAPPSLTDGLMVRQTLNRWSQLGLFMVEDELLTLHAEVAEMDLEGVGGLRELAALLRLLVLSPEYNEGLVEPEPSHAADFTHAVCWMLAQDPFELTVGNYDSFINPKQTTQLVEAPWAFQNDTRWVGFVDWAPLLGFGWITRVPSNNTFMCDPTDAVEDTLTRLFGGREELPQAAFFEGLAELLPVVDGGAYRQQVEARIAEGSKPVVEAHQLSPSLSLALLRLEAMGRLVLDERSDAAQRTLLGRGFRELRKVSHLVLREVS